MLPIAILARDLSVPRISKKNLPVQVWPIAALILVLPFFEPTARAQQHPTMSDQTPVMTTPTGESSIIRLTVRGENKVRLDRQAVIKLYSHIKNAATWQTTSDSKVDFIGLGLGQYDVQVSAVGYLTTEKQVQIVTSQQTVELEVLLQKDPSAVDLSIVSDDLPQKVRKEANRALVALKSGNLKDAQKHLDKAYSVAPSSAEINFLFGYLCFQQKDFEKAEPYLQRASTLDSRNTPALVLLGRVQLLRSDFVGAQKALEQATAADPANWQAHELLAEVYLKQRDYERARPEAQFALDKGKGERSAALLILGQALAHLGRDQEGIQALNTFLQTVPESSVAPQVRALISELEKRDSGRSEHASTLPPLSASLLGDDLAVDDSQPSLPDRSWQPAGIDDKKPSVAADLTCPFEQVIDMSGNRIKQLVDDLNRFAAIEELLHERLDSSGNPASTETRKFDYIAAISDVQPGFLEVNEYRGQRYGASDLPDDIATHGFAALALVFHPEMRDNFQMTCEGLGDWRGQATWLVYFRQRDDRPNRIQSFIIGRQEYPINLKGRAWITADNFQIVRIESELVSPVPQIRLRTEHQIVEYGPIPFPKKNLEIWLPKSAEIYLDFRHRRYYRRHSFDHYMLFATDSQDKPDLTKYQSHDGQSKAPKEAVPGEAH
jgi:tetratricopeptide (TPR) repeat protein